MNKFLDVLFLSVGIALSFNWCKDHIAFEIVTAHDIDMDIDNESSMTTVFDCPACGLPSELLGAINDFDEDGTFNRFYIIRCFGDHETVAVTEGWLRENVLTI